MSGPLLQVKSVETYYGNIRALGGVNVEVNSGEIVCLIGANGAGKSTLMMTICGSPQARTGSVIFNGQDITRLPTHEIARLRIAQSPEGRRIFPRMTVFENLQMGALLRRDPIDETLEEIFALFPILAQKRHQLAGQLSGGQRQQLAVGRALMTRPSVLLLDEPTAGVSPNVMDELFDKITRIAAQGLAVLMVEQNAAGALEIADTGFVLVQGANRFTGAGQDLLNDPDTRRSFLGGRQ